MMKKFASKIMSALALTLLCLPAYSSEADLVVPSIKDVNPDFFNYLLIGIGISVLGLIFGLCIYILVVYY